MPLLPADRDFAIRTVIGEAADQPDEGLAAVGHVIFNRLNSGKFGKNVQEIVLAPNQFEPWTTRAKELRGIDPKSPMYQKVGKMVDDIAAGSAVDPTQGATHFLQPDIVKARRTYNAPNGLPDWAQGNSLRIGAHQFYAPDNSEWRGGSNGDLLDAHLRTRARPQVASAATEDLLTLYLRKALTPSAPATLEPPVDLTPRPRTEEIPTQLPTPKLAPVMQDIKDFPGNYSRTVDEYVKTGQDVRRRGQSEIQSGMFLPHGKLTEPSGWEPGGILNVLRGGITQLGAYPFAAVKNLIQDPATKMTGDPVFGEKAAMMVPVSGGRAGIVKPVQNAMPVNRALTALKEKVPENQLSEVITRMQENPRLSLVDVAPEVRIAAQGMIDPAQPKSSGVISQFGKRRQQEADGAVRGVYESTLGKPGDPLKKLDDMKAEAQEVGRKIINPAVEGAGPVDITNVVKHIEKEIGPYAMKFVNEGKQPPMAISNKQQKLIELRERLRGDQVTKQGDKVFMNAPLLHEIQSEWRIEAEGLRSSSVGSERLVAEHVGNARDKLVDAIDKAAGHSPVPKDHTRVYMGENELGRWYTTDLKKAEAQGGKWGEANVPNADMTHFPNPQGSKSTVPAITENGGTGTPGQQRYFNEAEPVVGAYRKGLGKYREAMSVPEAFEKGLEIERNRGGMVGIKEDRPEAWKRWVKDATPKQLEAARDASLLAIEHHIEQVRNHARKGMDIPESNFVGDKIKVLFGEDKGNQLLRRLRDERDIAETNTKLIGGSKTAETQAGQRSMAPREVGKQSNIGAGVQAGAAALTGIALGFPTHGGVAAALIGGGKVAKNLGQRAGRWSDLSRNKKFAEYATASEGDLRNELLSILQQEATKRQAVGQGNKIQNILTPLLQHSLTRALPR